MFFVIITKWIGTELECEKNCKKNCLFFFNKFTTSTDVEISTNLCYQCSFASKLGSSHTLIGTFACEIKIRSQKWVYQSFYFDPNDKCDIKFEIYRKVDHFNDSEILAHLRRELFPTINGTFCYFGMVINQRHSHIKNWKKEKKQSPKFTSISSLKFLSFNCFTSSRQMMSVTRK